MTTAGELAGFCVPASAGAVTSVGHVDGLGLAAFLAIAMPLWRPGQPVALIVAIAVLAGLVMAAVVAAVTAGLCSGSATGDQPDPGGPTRDEPKVPPNTGTCSLPPKGDIQESRSNETVL